MRIQSIDYLRGAMSLSIVFYHFIYQFTDWGVTDSGTLLGRLGIYAVSAFYIISGMALYLAHQRDKWCAGQYLKFLVRRFFRLAPTYWVALVFATAFGVLFVNGFSIDVWKYTQNVLLIFGITNPTEYIIMGGWSIGNEVVFYLLFPVFILATKWVSSLVLMGGLLIVTLIHSAFFLLDSHQTLASQWPDYINPMNQIYFFIAGVILAKLLLPYVGRRKGLLFVAVMGLALVFTLYPVTGNQINIVTGTNKLVFVLLTVLLCAVFFLIGNLLSVRYVHVVLKFLGDVSYPLYLLHGESFAYFQKFIFYRGMSDSTLFAYASVLLMILLILSWFCHVCVEKPAIRVSQYMKINGNADGLIQGNRSRS